MPDIPVGQLLILMAFILVPVINLLLQRMQRRVGRQPPKEEPPRQPAPRTFAEPPPLEVIASARQRVRAPDRLEIPPGPKSRARNKSFFRSRRDLRRAIILMAVLGPCCGVDSQDTEDPLVKQ
jgi:hypothetical protein